MSEAAPTPRLVPLLILVALLAWLPRSRAGEVFRPTPDAVEYAALARGLVEGRGFSLPIRAFHIPETISPGPARVPGAWTRAPLLPLLLAPRLGEAADPRSRRAELAALQHTPAWLAIALASLCAALTVTLGRHAGMDPWLRLRAAALAGVMIALHPPLFHVSMRLLTEPLELTLLVLGLLGAFGLDDTRPRPALTGIAAGLLCLARPDGLLLALAILVALTLRAGRGGLRIALPLMLIAAAPWWLRAVLVHGTPTPGQSFLLHVASSEDVQWGFGGPVESLSPGLITTAVLGNLGACLAALLEPKSLAFFAPVIGLAAWRIGGSDDRRNSRREALRDPATLTLALGLVLLLAKALVWSTRDELRFILPAVVLLVPLGALETVRLLPRLARFDRRLPQALLVILLGWLLLGPGVRVFKRMSRLPRGASWQDPDLERLRREVPPGPAIAATNPWAVWLATENPTVLLPVRLDEAGLTRFLDAHRVAIVRLAPDAAHHAIPEPVRYGAWLRSAGWTEQRLGRSRIYRRPRRGRR